MKRKASWLPYALAAGKTAWNVYKRFKSNRGRNTPYRRTRMGFRGAGAPVTNQFDVRTQYRAKRFSRQKRRRQRKFRKFAERVLQSDRALKIQCFLDNYNAITAVNNQAWHGFLLGGPNGTAGLNDDLRQIFNLESGVSNPQNWQLDFKSMVMDIEAVNNGTSTLIMDCYHVYCRRDVSNNDWANLQAAFSQGFTELATISGGVAINPATPGISPFDAPNFVEKFKIFKKERLILSPGQVSSFVVKDTRKRKIESTDSNEYTLLKGQKGILFIFSAAVDGGTIPISEMDFSVNRSYHYFELQDCTEAGAQG